MNASSPNGNSDFKSHKVKPFKVCFVSKKEIGRSNISIGKPLTIVPIVTQKFYTQSDFVCDNVETRTNRLIVTGPKEKFEYPRTENQKYGWYECDGLNDSKLNFKKSASQLIKEHLMIYAKIRE